MASSGDLMIPRPVRSAFRAVQGASHSLAAHLAERWFFTPPRAPARNGHAAFLGTGRRFTLRVDGRPVVGWTWGTGPTVYLVHGWGARGGRLRAFAGPLLDLGYRVVTFDAPGHGASGRGLSSMPEFARALRAVTGHWGPARAVIGHSLGAAATTLAAHWGLEAERFALLAPPADVTVFAQRFAAAMGIRPEVQARMRANSERRLRIRWAELDLRAAAARMTAPLLLVHDRDDDVVPFAEGAAIAASWPGARLVATTGLGHRELVRDPGVVADVVRFVAGGEAVPVLAGETARLEHSLFHRETRWRDGR
jgi:pimeloyl-ACP methyl ester carboxylesterase